MVSSALSVFLKGGPCNHALGANGKERIQQTEADSDEKHDHCGSILICKNRLDTCSDNVMPLGVHHSASDMRVAASAGEESSALFADISRFSEAVSVGGSAPPPRAVIDFVIEYRNGNISPFEATTRFYKEFGSQIIRTCGNNSHPHRYACMRDGSVVDTDKLTQIGSLCWIQDELDVQALLHSISNSLPQLESHVAMQGLLAVSAHDQKEEHGGSVKPRDGVGASLDGLSLVHRAAGTSFVRHVLSKGNSTDVWQGFLSFVGKFARFELFFIFTSLSGGRFDPTDFLRQLGMDVVHHEE